ncbi:prepilin-type N-terminal cleavage/methylation domain-containing protein [Pseudoduganella sp. DS3]|uniref:Prepilin-type N-terminal cleavage/methylation domain-containing protein n=1 Tax=Pseudoduganella guangdongensis TaxID=2692179 RepID=A0A6N9HMH8_9BURK|nr:type IV pilin protein [Pseudoduganella guangdongensis]MYN04901.1 prepilin-type N-terminal cleavage/methylation domain-containing protein [Pseudoduganella guangdongensis]
MKRQQAGYTLMEVMVAVTIVGIITAVGLPIYSGYVKRGRLTEAFTGLGAGQTSAEQYWANNRTYAGFEGAASFPKNGKNFDFALSNASPSGYTLSATGKGMVQGFTYTIDQNGNRKTTAVPAGYTTNDSCWVDREGGRCTN